MELNCANFFYDALGIMQYKQELSSQDSIQCRSQTFQMYLLSLLVFVCRHLQAYLKQEFFLSCYSKTPHIYMFKTIWFQKCWSIFPYKHPDTCNEETSMSFQVRTANLSFLMLALDGLLAFNSTIKSTTVWWAASGRLLYWMYTVWWRLF